MKHNFDLSEWLKSFGIIGGEVPDIVPVIQPVLVINERSQNVFPGLAPTQQKGALIGATASSYAAFAILAVAPGGCFIESALFTDVTAPYAQHLWRWKVQSADPSLGATATNTVFGTPECLLYTGVSLGVSSPFTFLKNEINLGQPKTQQETINGQRYNTAIIKQIFNFNFGAF